MLDLLRGDTRAAVVTNADDYKDVDLRAISVERELNDLRGVGLKPVEVDLRRYFDRPDALRPVLEETDLIWVRGGNPFILRRAMTPTGTDEILRELLAEDSARRDALRLFDALSVGLAWPPVTPA